MPQPYAMLSKFTPPAITAGFILYALNHLSSLEQDKQALGLNDILFLTVCTLMLGLSWRHYKKSKLPRNLHNTETFRDLRPVEQIFPEHLLILDKYAFDTQELVAYAAHFPHKLARNPHTNILFSINAINQLRVHPETCNGILAMEHQIRLENTLITDDIVDKVIELLINIDHSLNPASVEIDDDSEEDEINAEENPDQEAEWEVLSECSDSSDSSDPMEQVDYRDMQADIFVPEACNEAVINFQIYLSKLKAAQRNTLRNYLIEIYSTRGTGAIQGLEFCEALAGGDNVQPCVRTLQIYLWQFVVDFKSDLLKDIPPAVNKAAAAVKLQIRDNYSIVTYQGRNNTHCCARLFKRLQSNNNLSDFEQLASPRMGRYG